MAAEISKKEYLKRYMDSQKDKKKPKKKIQKKPQTSRFKIVDGDIDLKSINFGNDDDEIDIGDEAPVVTEVIDERPEPVKIKEQFKPSRWKKFGDDPNEETLASSRLSPDNHSSNTSRRRYDSDSDASLPRQTHKKQAHYDSDVSPPRKNLRKESRYDSDVSPPRQNHRKRTYNSDASPPRRTIKKEKLSDDDLSPPRKTIKQERLSDDDLSPPRMHKTKHQDTHRRTSYSNSSLDNSRKQKSRHDSDSDVSLERIPTHHTHRSKYSPSRHNAKLKTNNRHLGDCSPPQMGERTDSSDMRKDKRADRTLSGLKAGLQNAATLKKESAGLRKREKKKIIEMDEQLSGRNAETIVRDRSTGLKRDLAEERKLKDEEERKVAEHHEKYSKWGKGIEQTENRQNKLEEDLYEMSKPLARYSNDDDLEESLKAAEREGDTMAAYIKKKKKAAPSVPLYSGPPPPPNRFNILPGYRWDGVDRSNGFEKKFFERINKSKALETEAYLWSVQNM